MKRTSLISVIIGIACIAIGNGAPGTTTVAKPASQANRYLFVVDTSSAMSKLEHGGRQSVFDLVFSGLEGRMRPGDSFSVWTFNDKVSAGVFQIQSWDPEKKLQLASRVGLFLKEQSYGHKPLLDGALATAMSLVRAVKDLNVIVVCSGDASLKDAGPFANVVDAWRERAAVAKQEKRPVVFAFAAKGGQIVHRSIVLAGEPIGLPMPPPMLAAPKPPITSTNVAVRTSREPIIMKGPPPHPAPLTNAAVTAPVADTNQSVTAFLENPAVTSVVAAVQAPSEPPKPEPIPAAVEAPKATPPIEAQKPAPVSETGSSILPKPIPVAAREKPSSASATPVAAAQLPYAPITASRPVTISPRALMLAGGALMAIGLILAIWMFLHTRSRPDLSSITQSMNRVGWTEHQGK